MSRLFIRRAVLIVPVLAVAVASGEPYRWTGSSVPADASWAAGNWSFGGVPAGLPASGPLQLIFSDQTSGLTSRVNANDSAARTIASLGYGGGSWTTTGERLNFALAPAGSPFSIELAAATDVTLPAASFTGTAAISVPSTSTLTFTGAFDAARSISGENQPFLVSGQVVFNKAVYFHYVDLGQGRLIAKDSFSFTRSENFGNVEARAGITAVASPTFSIPSFFGFLRLNSATDRTYTPGSMQGTVFLVKSGLNSATWQIANDALANNSGLRTVDVVEGGLTLANFRSSREIVADVAQGGRLTLRNTFPAITPVFFYSAFPSSISGRGLTTIDFGDRSEGLLTVGNGNVRIVRGGLYDVGFTGNATAEPNGIYGVPAAAGTLASSLTLAGGTFRVFGPGGAYGWATPGTGNIDIHLDNLTSAISFPSPLGASLTLSITRGVVNADAGVPLPAPSILINPGGTLRVLATADTTLTAAISGSGRLTKTGLGTLTLAGASSAAFVSVGQGQLEVVTPLLGGPLATIETGASLRLNLPSSIDLGRFDTDGGGTLIKSGPSTVTVGTVASGVTRVEQGTLRARALLAADVSIAVGGVLESLTSAGGVSNLDVAAGATLAITGSLQISASLTGSGQITALPGGFPSISITGSVSPNAAGNPSGTLFIFAGIAPDGAGTELSGPVHLDLRAGNDHDRVIVGGSTVIFGPLVISLGTNPQLRPGEVIRLFDWNLFEGYTFSSITLPDPSLVTFDLSQLYSQGTIRVTKGIPEPGGLTLLTPLALTLGRRRRRRG